MEERRVGVSGGRLAVRADGDPSPMHAAGPAAPVSVERAPAARAMLGPGVARIMGIEPAADLAALLADFLAPLGHRALIRSLA